MDGQTGARKLTRFALIMTLFVSIVANVTHSVLATSEISLWLRVPGGVLWPTLTFVAIEIIVRTVWARRFSHYLARTLVLGPAVPAVIISYAHQRSLLGMMGEGPLVATIGPVAIDGLMIGCTLALLFTRVEAPSGTVTVKTAPTAFDKMAEDYEQAIASYSANANGAPATVTPTERKPRAARTPVAGEALSVAVERLQEGATPKDVAAETGLSPAACRRYAAVIRTLAADPNAPIDPKRAMVRADMIEPIRQWAASAR